MRDMFNEREYTTMLRFYDADFVHMPEEMQIMAKTFIEEIHKLEDKIRPKVGLVIKEISGMFEGFPLPFDPIGFNPYSDAPQGDDANKRVVARTYAGDFFVHQDDSGFFNHVPDVTYHTEEPEESIEIEIDPAWMM